MELTLNFVKKYVQKTTKKSLTDEAYRELYRIVDETLYWVYDCNTTTEFVGNIVFNFMGYKALMYEISHAVEFIEDELNEDDDIINASRKRIYCFFLDRITDWFDKEKFDKIDVYDLYRIFSHKQGNEFTKSLIDDSLLPDSVICQEGDVEISFPFDDYFVSPHREMLFTFVKNITLYLQDCDDEEYLSLKQTPSEIILHHLLSAEDTQREVTLDQIFKCICQNNIFPRLCELLEK